MKKQKPIIEITELQLIAMLQKKDAIKGGTFLGLITDTEETNIARPVECGLKGLRKICATVGQAFSHANYASLAKKADPNYEPKPRKWGERMNDFPLVIHTNKQNITKYYLEVFFLNDRVKTKVLGYYLNGEEKSKELVKSHMRPKEAELVPYRNYAIDSILEIAMNGNRYKIKR